MSTDFEVAMQGRIMALELLVRGLLVEQACRSERPLATARRSKAAFTASLQNVERPIDAYTDEVWGATADAARMMLDQVLQRISHLQDEGLIAVDAPGGTEKL